VPAGTPMQFALKYLGTRYVWGGSSPQQGFDCSGLVSWAFRQAGYNMPRDMWGQLQSGERVNKADLKPGDIVFFVNTYTRGLSHDAIYLGDGKFVHAATESLGIIISRLDETYWAARYYAAVRPKQ
jgi:cell wall-associated NlpC family hydrolase